MIRLIRHEESFEVRYGDGRPSKYFYFDDNPSRRIGNRQGVARTSTTSRSSKCRRGTLNFWTSASTILPSGLRPYGTSLRIPRDRRQDRGQRMRLINLLIMRFKLHRIRPPAFICRRVSTSSHR